MSFFNLSVTHIAYILLVRPIVKSYSLGFFSFLYIRTQISLFLFILKFFHFFIFWTSFLMALILYISVLFLFNCWSSSTVDKEVDSLCFFPFFLLYFVLATSCLLHLVISYSYLIFYKAVFLFIIISATPRATWRPPDFSTAYSSWDFCGRRLLTTY